MPRSVPVVVPKPFAETTLPAMINLQRTGDVFVLHMTNGENRFSPDMLHQFGDALGQVEQAEGPKALVTVGAEKYFSNGLDLDWLTANPNEASSYLFRVHSLFGRVLELPCATVAALNGHTFAAGAMLSLCHDHQVMRSGRGYWCLPEADLGMQFTEGMNMLIPAMLPKRTAHEAMVTGRRYTAEEALAAGIVNEIAAEADVLPTAIAHAQSLAPKAGSTIAGIRTHLYRHVIATLHGTEQG